MSVKEYAFRFYVCLQFPHDVWNSDLRLLQRLGFSNIFVISRVSSQLSCCCKYISARGREKGHDYMGNRLKTFCMKTPRSSSFQSLLAHSLLRFPANAAAAAAAVAVAVNESRKIPINMC